MCVPSALPLSSNKTKWKDMWFYRTQQTKKQLEIKVLYKDMAQRAATTSNGSIMDNTK